jgi:hypothetical protein
VANGFATQKGPPVPQGADSFGASRRCLIRADAIERRSAEKATKRGRGQLRTDAAGAMSYQLPLFKRAECRMTPNWMPNGECLTMHA